MRIELKNVLFCAAAHYPEKPSYRVTLEVNGHVVWRTTRQETPPVGDVVLNHEAVKWLPLYERDEAIEFAVAQRNAD